MKYNYCILFALAAVLSIFNSCSDDSPKPDPTIDDNVNAWIYETMENHYLWYKELPPKESLDMSVSPDEFFRSLLSDKDGKVLSQEEGHHYFSTIEQKKAGTKAIDSESSYGFEYAVAPRDQNGKYAALVIYTLPNSPASEAGLKRGDWIIGVNSPTFNITDYSILNKGNAAKFYIGQYDNSQNSFVLTGSVDMPASRQVEDTPFLADSVYSYGNQRIGYLMYNHFTSGPNGYNDKTYDDRMKGIFADFKSKNVNEFVLDLRYNGGGLVTSARLLSSLLAPANALGQPFSYIKYNDKNEKSNYMLPFETASSVSGSNLDLKRLYVLVSDLTASASEAVINCLIPYMQRTNIVLIGEQTIGKTVGSVTYGEKEDFNWLIHPIVMNITNADNEADYADGFAPDIKVQDLVVNRTLYPLGDTRERMLSIALENITGSVLKSASATEDTTVGFIYNSLDEKPTNGMLLLEE